MKFRDVPVAEAVGRILGHNVADAEGRRRLRKGRALSPADTETLADLGRTSVWVAELGAGDVAEDRAAERIAAALCGRHLEACRARTGRVNLEATVDGLLRVDDQRLLAANEVDGVTLATLRSHAPVTAGRMVATLKILPYALPEAAVARAEGVGEVLRLTPFERRRCGLVLSGSRGTEERLVRGFRSALGRRIEALGSELAEVAFVPVDGTRGTAAESDLASAIRRQLDAGLGLILVAGETAIQDRHDLAPRAVEAAGGVIEHFGAPVDPGNLLLLAYHGDVPVVGAPGCARSPRTNIVDLVLPRLLAGDRLTRRDLLRLGHGGLLEDVPERPLPRSRIG